VFVTFTGVKAFKDTKWRLLPVKEEHLECDVPMEYEDGKWFEPEIEEWKIEFCHAILAMENVPKEAILRTIAAAEFKVMGAENLRMEILGVMGVDMSGYVPTTKHWEA
jgi:hypothetical protein